MTYTLWSQNELLGESTLAYVRVFPNLRTGDLNPTDKGLKVIERLTQSRADIYENARRFRKGMADAPDELDQKTLLADLAAQADLHDRTALELRAADGSVIPTESIHITDTEYLLALGRECEEEDEALGDGASENAMDREVEAALEELLAKFDEEHPPWARDEPEREPARFQISVTLLNDWAIP